MAAAFPARRLFRKITIAINTTPMYSAVSEKWRFMKTLLLTLTATAGLVLSAITSQAQALIPIPSQPDLAPTYPAAVTYFDDYGILRHAALVPWWDPAALTPPVPPTHSHVFTYSGEVDVWPPHQYGPPAPKVPAWNHDGRAFERFAR
jgi:hypothetical protein